MRFCRMSFVVASMFAFFSTESMGAVNVTASRDYVDRKVHTLTTNVEERVENISNRLETVKTNLEDRISSAQPGNYLAVSNNAMNALSRAESTNAVKSIVTSEVDNGEYSEWTIQSDDWYLKEYYIDLGKFRILPYGTKWMLYKGPIYGGPTTTPQGDQNSTNLSWQISYAPGELGTATATRRKINRNELGFAKREDVGYSIGNATSGTVFKATYVGDDTQWTDGTGCVWRATFDAYMDTWDIVPEHRGWCVFWNGSSWIFQYEGAEVDTHLGTNAYTFSSSALGVTCYRRPRGAPELVGVRATQDDVKRIAVYMARDKSVMWNCSYGLLKCTGDESVALQAGETHPAAHCDEWHGSFMINGIECGVSLNQYVDFYMLWINYQGTDYQFSGASATMNPFTDPTIDMQTYEETPFGFTTFTLTNITVNALALPDFEDLAKKQDVLPYPTNQIPYSVIYNPPWLSSFTESDPTISSWAKASTKPSYTWSEIGSKPSFATVATSGAYYDLTGKPDLSKLLLIEDFDEWQTNSNIIIGRDNTWSESSDGIVLIGHDSTVTGEHAMAVGPYAVADGDYAMAFGTSEAKADYAVALGFDNFSLASEAFSAGLFSRAFFSWGSAVGYKSVSSNNYASAFGAFAEATGPQALALGPAKATELNAISIGTFAEASATNTVAIGPGAKAKAYLGTAIGTLAEAEYNGLAIGYNSYAGPGSVALGMGRRPTSIFGIYGAQAFGTRTYALGGYVESNVTDSVSIGTYAWNTNSHAVVISAGFNTINGPETRSHGDGTITLGVTNGLHDVWIGTNTLDEAISMDYAKKSESLSPDTLTNAVRSVVSVTSSYIWDAQDTCLYRREMKGGYLYWTPVTNVNALLPENIAILNYLEEHKND